MGQGINIVAVSGNLTRDPELRSTAGGTSVSTLRMAVNERRKDASGEWAERANFFDVVVWGAQAEACAKYLAKGRPVAVQGRLQWREWETREGGKRQTVEIVAERVQFLSSGEKREGNGGAPQSDVPSNPEDFGIGDDPYATAGGPKPSDDIPF